MTGPVTLPGGRDIIVDMDPEDLKNIRQSALCNISEEVQRISDLVESSMGDLSEGFMKLVKYSRQQTDDITMVCNLLQGEGAAKNAPVRDIIHEKLMAEAEISTLFQQNISKMIHTMQFQDRARQNMTAISVTLDILVHLSETIESLEKPVYTTISETNRNIVNRLIEDAGHKELDQSYILKIFMGTTEGTCDAGREESSDIEFF